MKKDILSVRQTFSIMILFVSSELILNMGDSLKGNGTWIAILIARLITFLVILLYSYIMSYFPDKDIFDVNKVVLGNVIGKIASILFALYGIYVAVMCSGNVISFIKLVTLQKTPIIIIGSLFVGWAAFSITTQGGIEAGGRIASTTWFITVGIWLFFILMLTKHMDFDNLLPILSEPIENVARVSYRHFSVIGGDLVLFMGILIDPSNKNNRRKAYIGSFFITGILLLANNILITAILGTYVNYYLLYPTYTALSLVNYANFISRIELFTSLLLLTCTTAKIVVGIYVAGKGLSKVTKIKSHNFWVYFVALVVLFLSSYSKDRTLLEKINRELLWAKNIVQIVIPLILAIAITIKKPKLAQSELIQ